MKINPRAVLPLVVCALFLPGVRLSAAQPPRYRQNRASVTPADIQRLQDEVYGASNDVAALGSSDPSRAGGLQPRLDDLRDEVVYLKVKLRKEGYVSRGEYEDLWTRVADLRAAARGGDMRPGTGTGGPPPPQPPVQAQPYPLPPPPPGAPAPYGGVTEQQVSQPGVVPAGQQLDVRVDNDLSSATAQVEDRFTAKTVVDVYQGNDILIPAGSELRGVVSSVTKASRMDRKGTLTLAFDQITVGGKMYPLHATVTQALEGGGVKSDAGKIGTGAGVGAILGGILGGVKGAALGILIGGGGTLAASAGSDVTLSAGSMLRITFDEPLQLR
ncbi:MAG TPA: hypothetical protein VGL62_09685 [Vicinamibacterales bacterium]